MRLKKERKVASKQRLAGLPLSLSLSLKPQGCWWFNELGFWLWWCDQVMVEVLGVGGGGAH